MKFNPKRLGTWYQSCKKFADKELRELYDAHGSEPDEHFYNRLRLYHSRIKERIDIVPTQHRAVAIMIGGLTTQVKQSGVEWEDILTSDLYYWPCILNDEINTEDYYGCPDCLENIPCHIFTYGNLKTQFFFIDITLRELELPSNWLKKVIEQHENLIKEDHGGKHVRNTSRRNPDRY